MTDASGHEEERDTCMSCVVLSNVLHIFGQNL